MLQRLDVLEDGQREEEEENRQRGENGQRYIQAAVKLLPCAAMGAFGEMLLVVLRISGEIPEMSYRQLARMAPTTLSEHRVLAIYSKLSLQRIC